MTARRDVSVCAVLLAAGASLRMGENKLLIRFGGKTPIKMCLAAFDGCKTRFDRIVIAVSDDTRQVAEDCAAGRTDVIIVQGGAERGDSVYNALCALAGADVIAIHDAARCLVTPEIIDKSVSSALEHGSGIAGMYCRDTLRMDGALLPRERVFVTQTPQTFDYALIRSAYETARQEGYSATDDCALYEHAGHMPAFVSGGLINQKLTGREDIPFFAAAGGHTMDIRVGYGEDTHRLAENRRLVIGGVEIPYRLGLLGHSDADVLVHSVMDALLGAAALGDIGRHFPPGDPAYKGISSLLLLARVRSLLEAAGFALGNIDATVVAQEPKLMEYIPAMQKNIAETMGMEAARVSVKATTPEHTGPEGALECITARCVCALIVE